MEQHDRIVMGIHNKTGITLPYIRTKDYKKANKALEYCKLKYPDHHWEIKIVALKSGTLK